MEKEIVKGYKVTTPDLTCNGYQYELNKIFEHDGEIQMCSKGFHFCRTAVDCFNYYDFDPNNRVFEIIAHGEVIDGDDKSITNKIELIREIPWLEVLATGTPATVTPAHSAPKPIQKFFYLTCQQG